MNKRSGFTIVELLVVIVVIGVLAAITIVSYSGISSQAIAASLKTDLTNAARQIKISQVDNGIYPTTIDCSVADDSTNRCVKSSGSTKYTTYSSSNVSNPQSFTLEAMNGTVCYQITDDSPPVQVTCTWVAGRKGTIMEGKLLYKQDEATTLRWKTSTSACTEPQCSTGLDTNPGYESKSALKKDNTIDYSLYPARDACKSKGARLPYTAELQELASGKSTYGNFLSAGGYWTATSFISSNPYFVQISNGSISGTMSSTSLMNVRCIKD